MPNSMEETINKLRDLILSKVEKSYGFSSDNIPDKKCAENAAWGKGKKDSDSWESLLLERDTIKIFLKYDIGRKFSDAQKIILHGNEFGAVRLVVYDELEIDIQTSKKKACDCLFGKISENGIYGITEVQERNRKNKSGTKKVGHVLDLYIKNTNEDGSILSPDQTGKASAELVEKIVATVKDRLPVAKYYADYREDLLSGKL